MALKSLQYLCHFKSNLDLWLQSNAVIEVIQLSTNYLDSNYQDITDPFEMAITSYALFVSGTSREKYNALNKLDAMKRTGKGSHVQLFPVLAMLYYGKLDCLVVF